MKKYYFNKKDNSFLTTSVEDYLPNADEIEVDKATYTEFERKIQNGYTPNFSLNNNVLSITYTKSEEQLKNELRAKREPLLRAFDIYKTNLSYGIFTESESEHNEIISWYKDLLDLKDNAFTNIPENISKYL